MEKVEIKVNTVNNEDSEELVKCRTCNASSNNVKYSFLFGQWKNPWSNMQTTIANDLKSLTRINLKEDDGFSKSICEVCCMKLREACIFIKLVQDTNAAMTLTLDNVESPAWPKPILVDKTIPDAMDIKIKQEVLSDEDDDRGESWINNSVEMTDIKIEPEEMICSESLNSVLHVNGHNEPLTNGDYFPIEAFSAMVKEELSEDEWDSDLPLNCLLCSKLFSCLSGLKAHVIAQHSYNIRLNNSLKIVRHVCVVCKRTFETSTDLMVHETCHNKNKCYDCNKQFNSFAELSKHSRSCTVSKQREVSSPKVLTLEEVRRNPTPEEPKKLLDSIKLESEPFKCNICGSTFTDEYYWKVHEETHESGDTLAPTAITTPQEETRITTQTVQVLRETHKQTVQVLEETQKQTVRNST